MEFILQVEKVVIKHLTQKYKQAKKRVKHVMPKEKLTKDEKFEQLEQYIPDHR